MTRDFLRYEQRFLDTHPGALAPSKSKKQFAPDFPMCVPSNTSPITPLI